MELHGGIFFFFFFLKFATKNKWEIIITENIEKCSGKKKQKQKQKNKKIKTKTKTKKQKKI